MQVFFKKWMPGAVVLSGVVLSGAAGAQANTIFSDDFNRAVLNPGITPNWVGKDNTAAGTSGQIVAAPVDFATHQGVMNFAQTTLGGDAFSYGASAGFNVVSGQSYTLEFDYAGVPIFPDPNGNGGFIGLQDNGGNQYWMGGTLGTFLGGGLNVSTTPTVLTDDNTWHQYAIAFTPHFNGVLHVMVEDFNFVGGPNQPGDAYFDNIAITTVPTSPAVVAGGGLMAAMGLFRLLRKPTEMLA